MASRLTRSAVKNASISASTTRMAQPFLISKRKLKKNLTDKEQEEVNKFEIKGNKLTYRVKSIKEILNEMHKDAEKKEADNETTKKRRRSSIKRATRKSVAHLVIRKKLNLEDLQQEVSQLIPSELISVANTDSKNENCLAADVTEAPLESTKINPTNESNEDANIADAEIKIVIIADEEESEEQKEANRKHREKALVTMQSLKQEQEEWIKLLQQHEFDRNQAQMSSKNSTTSLEDGNDHLSEEQRQFLEKRVDPNAFLDELQNEGNEFCSAIDYVHMFAMKMKNFKDEAVRYLDARTEFMVSKEKAREQGSDTPRRLINTITRSAVE